MVDADDAAMMSLCEPTSTTTTTDNNNDDDDDDGDGDGPGTVGTAFPAATVIAGSIDDVDPFDWFELDMNDTCCFALDTGVDSFCLDGGADVDNDRGGGGVYVGSIPGLSLIHI